MGEKKRVVALFPGQGSQYIGMCHSLTSTQEGRNILQEASDILGMNIRRICEEENEKLYQTEVAQPVIVTVSYGMYQWYLQQGGTIPQLGLGHSLGEISALACAESMTFEETLKLVQCRGKVMAEVSNQYVMSAVTGISVERIETKIEQLNKAIYISNYNTPYQTVITGLQSEIEAFEKIIEQSGGCCKRLKTFQPFHTELMREAANKFAKEIETVNFKTPKFKVISNVTGKVHTTENIKRRLIQQIYSPVKFTACMNTVRRNGGNLAIEFGGGHVISRLAQKNVDSLQVYALDDLLKQDQTDVLWDALKIEEVTALTIVKKCMQIITTTKFENYSLDNHNLLKSEYNKLVTLYAKVESEEKQSDIKLVADMQESVEILKRCMLLKGISESERKRYIDEVSTLLVMGGKQ